MAVEVGAHREHDRRRARAVVRQRGERRDELRPLGRVAAEAEDLLELVDGQEQAPARPGAVGRPVEHPHGPLAWAQDALGPVLAARQDAAGELGQQPRP